jgi:hypothetical protein
MCKFSRFFVQPLRIAGDKAGFPGVIDKAQANIGWLFNPIETTNARLVRFPAGRAFRAGTA